MVPTELASKYDTFTFAGASQEAVVVAERGAERDDGAAAFARSSSLGKRGSVGFAFIGHFVTP